jgi:cell wall-associated NlpC family hydrolase
MFNTLLAIMASQFIGVPYGWSGDSYDKLDCSGLVLKSLRETLGTRLPDMTAQSIYHWAESREGSISCEPGDDCLLFFGGSVNNIIHVSIGLGDYNEKPFMIEAGGAGKNSLSMTPAELARIDARVRIKPVSNRGDLVASIKIIY